MNSKIAIQLSNVSKNYSVKHERPIVLRKIVSNTRESFTAINNVSLTINRGERIGIVGPNGSGKTTLLKIISGITTPSSGSVVTNGKIASLIDLEAGFYPDLTGYQNIFLNGALLGLSKKYVSENLNKIIRIADISPFLDVPFYTYSSGMKFRLAFAVAIISQCDIFIMDEIFVSGDIEFQKRSLQMINQLQKNRNITTIVCSHIPAYVLRFSKKIFMMNKGKISNLSPIILREKVKKINDSWVDMFLSH